MKKIVYHLLGISCLISVNATAQISTYAGTGGSGNAGDGGAATAAQLFAPAGLALDQSGNLYIADQYNNAVRKVSSTGIMTTVAGTFAAGYSGDSAAATAAKLNAPTGVAVDADGNLYIADNGNNRIRKVNTSGMITTIAGTGISGYNGDAIPATSAKVNAPWGVCADKKGNVIFTEYGGNRVRKINSAGIVTTLAGTGNPGYNTDNWPSAKLAMVYRPAGITVDSVGNVIFADFFNNMVRRIDTNNIINTLAGTAFAGFCDNQVGTRACFMGPSAVAIDAKGNIYVSDKSNFRLAVILPDGTVRGMAGSGTRGYSGDGGDAKKAKMTEAMGVAVEPNGTAYVADWGNNRVRKVTNTLAVSDVNEQAVIGMDVYPNPVSGHSSFTVVVNGNLSEALTLTVSDVTGKKINVQQVLPNTPVQMNLDVPVGVYMITAEGGSVKYNQKLEVVH